MPKTSPDFPVRLEFMTTRSMRVKLTALAFLTGSGKSYARVARTLLTQGIDAAIEGLDPKRRKAFDEIVASVEIAVPQPKKRDS